MLISELRSVIAKYSFNARGRKSRAQLLEMVRGDSRCVEVGVWKGEFSKEILDRVNPKELHLIDPWKFQLEYSSRWYGGSVARNQKDMDKIYDRVVDSFRNNKRVVIHRKYSDKAAEELKNGYFDFIYLDGNHSYEYVTKDLERYFQKIKKGGILAGDDYFRFSKLLDFGVKKAVDEFVKKRKLKMIKLGKQFVIHIV